MNVGDKDVQEALGGSLVFDYRDTSDGSCDDDAENAPTESQGNYPYDDEGDGEDDPQQIEASTPPERKKGLKRVLSYVALVTLVLLAAILATMSWGRPEMGGLLSLLGGLMPGDDETLDGNSMLDEEGMSLMMHDAEIELQKNNPIQDQVDEEDEEGEFNTRAGVMPPDEVEEVVEDVELPKRYADCLGNVEDPYDATKDTAFFWHVAKSGGTTIQDIFDHCFHLVDASQIGAINGHEHDSELQIITHEDGSRYVNVDTTYPEGIIHAKSLGLAESGMADFIESSYFYEASDLFSAEFPGRPFTVLRHPIERAISLYYYLQKFRPEATRDPLKPGDGQMTLEEYSVHSQTEHNWMTRFLSNDVNGQLFPRHLELAKKVLREKFVIGFMDRLEESLLRFEQYFGWEMRKKELKCQERMVSHGDNVNEHEMPDETSEAWQQFKRRNYFDIELYEYALELYEEQGQTLFA